MKLPLTRLAAPGLCAAACCSLLLLSPVGARADPVSGGKARLQLGRDLSAKLRHAGVRLSARAPARINGSRLGFPVSGGELAAGVGQVRLEGELRLGAGSRSASLGHLVLDTASGALIGRLNGRQVLIASARRPREKRHNFGFEITLGKLVLTDTGAARLDGALALGHLLSGKDVLGTATAGVRFSQLTVTHGTGFLELSDGFVAKLRALEVGTEATAGGWIQSTSPLTVALSKLHGTIALDLSGGLVESTGGLRLFVGQAVGGDVYPLPGAPEVTLQDLAVDLAGKSAEAEVRAQPPGTEEATTIGSLSEFPYLYRNAFTGEVAFGSTVFTLPAVLAAVLNRTLAESRGKPATFLAGEPFGRIVFDNQTH